MFFNGTSAPERPLSDKWYDTVCKHNENIHVFADNLHRTFCSSRLSARSNTVHTVYREELSDTIWKHDVNIHGVRSRTHRQHAVTAAALCSRWHHLTSASSTSVTRYAATMKREIHTRSHCRHCLIANEVNEDAYKIPKCTLGNMTRA